MPVMREALALYDRMGFEPAEPFSDDPTAGAIFMRKSL